MAKRPERAWVLVSALVLGGPQAMTRPRLKRNQRSPPGRPEKTPVDLPSASEFRSGDQDSAVRIAWLLFGSGCCALMLQVAWIRQFRLVFGGSTFASAAVIAIFMGGLGLGNALFGHRADRSPRPFFLYGVLEMGVALSSAITPWLLVGARWVYLQWGGQTSLGLIAATGVRLGLATVVLGLPTILMGSSFPAAIRAATGDADENRRTLPLLYGMNTLGAVAGAVLTTFVALEHLGTRDSIWVACACIFLIGFVAVRWSRTAAFREAPRDEDAAPAQNPQRADPSSQKGTRGAGTPDAPRSGPRESDRRTSLPAVYAAAFTAGFVFMLMELTWSRMLTPILGGSTYTFGLILAVALLGLGLGSLIYHAWLKRWTPSLELLTITFGLEGLAVAVPLILGDRIAIWASTLNTAWRGNFYGLVVGWSTIAALIIFPAAVISGMQLPLLVGLAGHGRRNVGRHVGGTFGANTFGAIAGSLAGGFGALPLLGAVQVWRIGAWILFTCCLLAWLGTVRQAFRDRNSTSWRGPRRGLVCLAMVACGVVGMHWSHGPSAAWRHSGIGVGRAQVDARSLDSVEWFLRSRRREFVWEADGMETGVGIMRGDGLSFFLDGKSDGSALGDKATQIGLGLLGGILRPEAKTALVVGMGTGETAGWLADQQAIDRVDVVELERAVLEMTRRCEAVNRGVLHNPKVEILVNDAREVLLAGDTQYDLIVSEPSNPYRAGIATLFTCEFYQAVQRGLARDGLFLQWIQAYEVSEETIGIILNTLRSVFPSVEIWQTQTADLLFVCGEQPSFRTEGVEVLRQRLQQPTIREGLLVGWGVEDVEGLVAHFVCGLKTVDEARRKLSTQLNTDDRTVIEYQFAKTVSRKHETFEAEQLRPLARQLSDDLPAVFRGRVSQARVEARRMAMYVNSGGDIPPLETIPAERQELSIFFSLYLKGEYARATSAWQRLESEVGDPITDILYAHALVETGQALPASVLERIRARRHGDANILLALGAWTRNDRQAAKQEALRALELMRSDPWLAQGPGKRMLGLLVDLSGENQATARELFDILALPFAADRFDQHRKLMRFLIAKQLEAKELAEALEVLEPHVPWNKAVLEVRAAAYEKLGHPRAVEAKRDWQRMQASLRETGIPKVSNEAE